MPSTQAVVDLGKIARNVRSLRSMLGAGVRLMAVVKADAYGHGAVPVSRAVLDAGAEWLAVALVEEGRGLRQAGIAAPILVLGSPFPEDLEDAVVHRLAVAVCERETALALQARASALGRTTEVHVKVDTGMGRVGLSPDDALSFVEWLGGLDRVKVGGIFSHFASSDEEDLTFARLQLERFLDVLRALDARGQSAGLRHMANTAATMALPGSHLDLVRTGIGIYGLYPSAEVPRSPLLEPAMAFVTRVVQVKDVPAGSPLSYGSTFVTSRPSRIATLAVGYADGYPRLLSNRGEVLIRGALVPVVGRVCMDMTLVDVTGAPEVRAGDEAVLFGRQGNEEITADELAAKTGTIHYEITCGVSKRVPRRYVRSGEVPR